ncbi:MAG: hypothetical protein A3H98_03410 [Bacteroidetes bacterium RIFCSPLOWO2_02_FULL_36_8]|nr:MAG: hypothetical protein A3H98_03410 [Bacteroidetes bacterium RIFCSPLOWO2_02_FULL_36_8]OFY69490.1 MAG: hypothetical protein A3G23_10655 [Bacteroidetes bacterium RIFCSPLOWO2_12_FULL_37_12]
MFSWFSWFNYDIKLGDSGRISFSKSHISYTFNISISFHYLWKNFITVTNYLISGIQIQLLISNY